MELTHELDCGTSTLLEYQSKNWDNNHDKIKLTQVQVKGILPISPIWASSSVHKIYHNVEIISQSPFANMKDWTI